MNFGWIPPLRLQVEAESQPELSEKYEVVAVPTFIFIQVCFTHPIPEVT